MIRAATARTVGKTLVQAKEVITIGRKIPRQKAAGEAMTAAGEILAAAARAMAGEARTAAGEARAAAGEILAAVARANEMPETQLPHHTGGGPAEGRARISKQTLSSWLAPSR